MSEKSKQNKIGKYEILEKIGEGGFGIVYRGRDPMLDRDVAIKVLRAELAALPDFVERFRREARLAASLRHPNIVGIIEVGEHESSYFLVMEYLAGQALADLFEEGKPLPLTRAVELLHPLASALDYAHSKGVIHRDVKPGNIILADDGKRLVLTDFGLVKSRLEEGTTTTGVVLGTPEYMSPEQIQGKELGPASDQYALGIIAYQMLTGCAPFHGTTPFEIQNGHVSQPPPNPLSLNSSLPSEIAKYLLRILDKDPTKRYPNILAFVNDLKQIADQWKVSKVDQLMGDTKQQMAIMNFNGAIARLEQLQAIVSLPEAIELLQECQRRQEKWNQVQELLKRQEQVGIQIDELTASEKWVKLPASLGRGYLPSSRIGVDVTHKTVSIDRLLFVLLIAFTALGILFAMQVGYQAPSMVVIRSLCSFAPSFSYIVSPNFLIVYSVFTLVCWIFWLLSRRSRHTLGSNLMSEPEQMQKVIFVERLLYAVSILFTVIELLFAMQVGYQVPSMAVIQSLCSFAPGFSYIISPSFLIAYSIFTLFCWIPWLLYKLVVWWNRHYKFDAKKIQ